MSTTHGIEFRKTTLSNGVRIVTETHPHSHAVSAGIWMCVGSRDEKPQHMGLAHFLEHLVFKGTRKRSAYQLAKVMESRGGDLNAFTSRESICFHALALPKDLELMFDVLLDLSFKATIPEKDYDLERKVIQQEIAMYFDSHEEYIFDYFSEKSYPKHPMGWSILGTHHTLEIIKRSDVIDFYKKMFVGENVIVGVCGPVEHEKIVELLRPHLEKLSSKTPKLNRTKPKYKKFKEHIVRETEQSHILMGFNAPHIKHPLRFASYIVNTALGGGMTSVLYQQIREKKGLAYSVYSSISNGTDSGQSLIYAGTDPDKVDKVKEIIFTNLRKLKRDGFNKNLLERFKTQITGYMIINEDDLESRMTSLCLNEMIFEKYRSTEDVIKSIQDVSVGDVREYIEKYLDVDSVSELTLGPKLG